MNILDTRDLNDRLIELAQSLADAMNEATSEKYDGDNIQEKNYEKIKTTLSSMWESEIDEFFELMEMRDEISEWNYGVELIPIEDFTEYCQDLLEDCGEIPKDLPWYIEVDWVATAKNISVDYSIITYQGTDYYYRNC
jgi:hypothetical protein